ncbi:MAG: hypothetical protein KF749_01045 [Bacteroidetes bacterium]|nr:hypothetical protein [Bacteroidota bacterium]MCW5897262.1 hypothetical protein [Bacteroidota bacterium]
MNPAIQKLVQLAEAEVGTREQGGNNRGTRIEMTAQQATASGERSENVN